MKKLTIGNSSFELGKKPLIMGILNVTPDSFFDGDKYNTLEEAVTHAVLMEKQGADIIDIGGESTRPGAHQVTLTEEINRIIPILEQLIHEIKTPISIDTYKSEVARRALNLGVAMINDVTALQGDKTLASLVADHNIPICIMHMKGKPSTMQYNPTYDDVIKEISDFFTERIRFAITQGIDKGKIIIDPGIGFGKRTGGRFEDNCVILQRLREFKKFGLPLLVGPSRKTFIGNVCGKNSPLPLNQRLEGSLAAACIAVLHGADIIRVHDVKETRRCLNLVDCVLQHQ